MITAARKLTPTSYFADAQPTALYVIASSGNITLNPAAATLQFTGETPTITNTGNIQLDPAAAALAFTGNTPTLTLTDNITLTPDPAVLSFTTARPVIYINGIPLSGSVPALFSKGRIFIDVIQDVIQEVIQ